MTKSSRGVPRVEVTESSRVPRLYQKLELLSPGAVSYTHLRAHETRGNLVCRLLLEKKNEEKEKRKTARVSGRYYVDHLGLNRGDAS